jgi:hypothetical protein
LTALFFSPQTRKLQTKQQTSLVHALHDCKAMNLNGKRNIKHNEPTKRIEAKHSSQQQQQQQNNEEYN